MHTKRFLCFYLFLVSALCAQLGYGQTYSTYKGDGTIGEYGKTYQVVKYSAGTGTWTAPYGVSSIKLLLVAGGGGGGGSAWAGGGGAGGVVYTNYSVTQGTAYSLNVGTGGSGGSNTKCGDGSNGSDSWFGNASFAAKGGGGGGGYGWPDTTGTCGQGVSGGSSGGAAETQMVVTSPSITQTTPLGATYSYGNIGGKLIKSDGSQAGTGGGGAGAAGEDVSYFRVPGNGGDGKQFDITGANIFYAGGGGGGSLANQAFGGEGGGGNGAVINGERGSNGTDGLGGGGGGAQGNIGGDGGDGIIIISFEIPKGTGHLTIVNNGGDEINSTWEYSNNTITTLTYNASIDASIIEGYVNSNTLTITANSISVEDDLEFTTSGNGITFKAISDITIKNAEIKTNGGDVHLWSDSNGSSSGRIGILNGDITTAGGNITLSGGTDGNGYAVGNNNYIPDIPYYRGIWINNSILNAYGTSSGGNIQINGK